MVNRTKFVEYVQLREAEEGKATSSSDSGGSDDGGMSTKLTLGDGNDYEPFMVSDDSKSEHYGKNKNLAPIVRAFKEGANWGWSKDDKSGEDKPVKISGRKLFLAGGAVRDHLKGKKARNIELGTNASPDEVYHILKQNGFDFVNKEKGTKSDAKNKTKNPGNQSFWVEKTSKNGRPFIFGVQINEDEFELSVFSKSPKGMVDVDAESGSQKEDAAGRDFTMNSMYILLSNDNGPNKELVDFYGGSHHLKSGQVMPVGDMSKKFKEDPSRILRYVRMLAGYGNPDKVSGEHKETLGKLGGLLGKLDRKTIMDEFKKGMKKDDCDSRSYIKLFKDLGLLGHLFPGKALSEDIPKECSEMGDKQMPLAWLLKNNPVESLGDLGMDEEDTKKIGFLIKSLSITPDIDPMGLDELTKNYYSSGVSSRKLRDWATKVGGIESPVMDAFLQHVKSPRVRVITVGDDGEEHIGEEFIDLVDPFTGERMDDLIEDRKKSIEYNNFKKHMSHMHKT